MLSNLSTSLKTWTRDYRATISMPDLLKMHFHLNTVTKHLQKHISSFPSYPSKSRQWFCSSKWPCSVWIIVLLTCVHVRSVILLEVHEGLHSKIQLCNVKLKKRLWCYSVETSDPVVLQSILIWRDWKTRLADIIQKKRRDSKDKCFFVWQINQTQ